MLDQVQPPPGALALGTQLWGRQPDRWDKIAEGELGKHASVDLVGLARQRRQPLGPLRVGDQHLPPIADQLVMHVASAVHRLNHPAHRHAIHRHPAREPVQTVAVTRRPEMLDQLPLARDQAHIQPLATEIQTRMQHPTTPPFHKTCRISPTHRVT